MFLFLSITNAWVFFFFNFSISYYWFHFGFQFTVFPNECKVAFIFLSSLGHWLGWDISKQKGMLAGNFRGKKKGAGFHMYYFCMYYTDGFEHVLTFITWADLGFVLNRHLSVLQLNIIEPVPKTKCCMQGLHTVQQFIQSGFIKIDLIRIKENMTQLSFHLR